MIWAAGACIGFWLLLRSARARLLLSRAKARSLDGHPRWAKTIARAVPFYGFDDDRFFGSDGAPSDYRRRRQAAFDRLAHFFAGRAPRTQAYQRLASMVPDLQLTNAYRVPFQYRRQVAEQLPVGPVVGASAGVLVSDLDGNAAYDLTGSYGVNLFGYDFYKDCVDAGIARVRDLGPVLGPYHPIIEHNVARLREISGMDDVSFHMSGTEAVMQAVRLARFHTRRSHVVRFAGAYHGWWDDVQPGPGNPAAVHETYTLKEMDPATLAVLDSRRDIACALVNPIQSLHPNRSAPSDGTLVASGRSAQFDRRAYTEWLQALREVCTKRSILLIFDEVFVGFRIARGGAQEYFGVAADLVTYGKTVGGGLPVGVVCGKAGLMKRFRDDRPSDLCFARGTFNSHPYVMGAMAEFFRRLDEPDIRRTYDDLDAVWNARASALNARLARERLPVCVEHLVSIWTVIYTTPSRYNWMFQYYLRAEGLALSWVGTGRLIFSHNFSDDDVAAVLDRFVAAARAMRDDGWWWESPLLTDGAIRRQLLRELIAARLAPRRHAAAHAASSDTIGSNSSPLNRYSGDFP
ncbi:MAG TPA: aminotransferase class III-fold pyridoxal phosphate-dependent enzyme [Vicinamibacterales bacterium]